MAFGVDARGEGASHHRPTDTAPPTLPALHRNLATEPRSTVSEASGPGAPSSPGPHPDRAGGGDNNLVHGADGHPWQVLGYEHTRPSTYQGTTVALEPLRSSKRHCRTVPTPDAGQAAHRAAQAPSCRPGRLCLGRVSVGRTNRSGGWVEVLLRFVPVVVADEPSEHPALLVTVPEVDTAVPA
jgi:hypothetical protein